MMQVIRAKSLGMCFGVKDALRLAHQVPQPEQITIHGQLVHNPLVNAALRARGFQAVDETHRTGVPATPGVLITAHGISNSERAALEHAGKRLIDTTCPLVRRAHDAALTLARQGHHVLVIGRADHVEVRGLTGDLPSFDVIESPADVRCFGHPRLGIICQTTVPAADARALQQRIAAANPQAEIRCIDTVCQPTKDRQMALLELFAQVQAVVVVGGAHSNNTRQLVRTSEAHGMKTFHVEHATDLRPGWFAGIECVGLTAGTSTLDSTIRAVESALLRIGNTATSLEQARR
jgi:4-hydroxy-3-methylbut-2-en-1-yl diphosphate reductase